MEPFPFVYTEKKNFIFLIVFIRYGVLYTLLPKQISSILALAFFDFSTFPNGSLKCWILALCSPIGIQISNQYSMEHVPKIDTTNHIVRPTFLFSAPVCEGLVSFCGFGQSIARQQTVDCGDDLIELMGQKEHCLNNYFGPVFMASSTVLIYMYKYQKIVVHIWITDQVKSLSGTIIETKITCD